MPAPSKEELRQRRRRRSRTDNTQLAQPKPGMRIIDHAVLQWARDLGVCEWCGRVEPTDPSHSHSVGSGGDDTYQNLTAICRRCHDEHHSKNCPSTEQLIETAKRREFYGRDRAQLLAARVPGIMVYGTGGYSEA